MKLDFGVLCDQVRKEDNGKLIFIGVYASDVGVPVFPSTVVLSLVLSFKPRRAGKEKFDLTVSYDGQQIVGGSAECDIVDTKRSFVTFQNIPIQLTKKGRLEFHVASGGKSLKAWEGDVLGPPTS